MINSAKVAYHISKPIDEVFDAIINQEKITKYFISKTTGNLVEGAELTWFWEDYGVQAPVRVTKIVDQSLIEFTWGVDDEMGHVSMVFTEKNEGQMHLEITEGKFDFNEKGVAKMLNQTQGWTDFCCCLKAYLYAGINLRK